MEERRAGRIGTVSGLALLTGSTAVATVTGGAHSFFATGMLGLLALGMAHALLDEIRRQARRQSARGWSRHDTVNTVLLGIWSAGTLAAALPPGTPGAIRAVGLTLALGYALSCVYFVVERRRAITGGPRAPAEPSGTSTPERRSPTR